MQHIKAIILGIIQGLTEFLPVSSSGHLTIFKHLMEFETPDISFEIFLHFGSLIAVLIYFRHDLINLTASTLKITSKSENDIKNRKVVYFLLASTFVTAFLGITFKDILEKIFAAPIVASVMLLVTGAILYVSDKIKEGERDSSQIGFVRSIIIGFGQSFAMLPGISRSGTTIAVSIFTGMKREEAARFSFLLSVPAILGAIVLSISDMVDLTPEMWISYISGAIAAFVSGYLVISILISLVKKQKLKYFSYYCWLLGIGSFIFFQIG